MWQRVLLVCTCVFAVLAPAGRPLAGDTGGADLKITMKVNEDEVSRGDVLEYSITLRNQGDRAAQGLIVTSHVPEHTRLRSGDECGGEVITVTENPGAPGGHTVCVSAPGPPAPGEHGFVDAGRTLDPGEKQTITFEVVVGADAPEGADLQNHAHVEGVDIARKTSNTVSTEVEGDDDD